MEVGLGFLVDTKKDVDFVGKAAFLADKAANKKNKNLAIFKVEGTSGPGQPLILPNEPIYAGKTPVGEVTSANFSFCFNTPLLMAHVSSKVDLKSEPLQVEIGRDRFNLTYLPKPLHDPSGEKMRS